MGRHGPNVLSMSPSRNARKGPQPTTQKMGAHKEMTDEKKSIAYKLGSAYGTIKKHRETSRVERIERREKELPIREKELALKEREARLNARQAKLKKSGGSSMLGGIMGNLEQAFGQPQSGKGHYEHSKSSRSFEPLIPDPLSDNPYGRKRRK